MYLMWILSLNNKYTTKPANLNIFIFYFFFNLQISFFVGVLITIVGPIGGARYIAISAKITRCFLNSLLRSCCTHHIFLY